MNTEQKFQTMGLEDSTLNKMAEFKQALEKVSFTKTAEKSSVGLAPALLLAGAIGAAPAIGDAISGAVGDYKLKKAKEPAFNAMLEYHPQLKNEDMDTVRKYFDSAWHFSPHLAQDPLAAGAYIRHALQYKDATGGPAPNLVGDLSQLEKNVSQSRGSKSNFLDFGRMPMPELML